MTNKNFNAKKVLMSTVAAVALSFVFTTNADAIRVKSAPQPSKSVVQEKKQTQKEESNGFILFLKQMFGVRV